MATTQNRPEQAASRDRTAEQRETLARRVERMYVQSRAQIAQAQRDRIAARRYAAR